jgi:RIO kinase 1
MPENDLSALESLLKSREFLYHVNLDRKTADLVFDGRTLKALYEFMSRNSIDYIDFPISSGKESVVFKAYSKGKPVVIKVYKLSTLRFGNIWRYIEGDYRFSKERIHRSNIVNIWAKKEFTNLKQLKRYGIPCPRPIAFHKNLLLMSYVGTKVAPAPMLKEVDVDFSSIYYQVVEDMGTMYRKAKLVHADMSEYNLLYHRRKAYFVDVGQAVDRGHPAADYFLERDIRNVVRFFSSKGIKCNFEDLLRTVKGGSVAE